MEKTAYLFDWDGVIADSMIKLHFNHIKRHVSEITFEEWMKLSNGNYWLEAQRSKYSEQLEAIRYAPDFEDYIKAHVTVPLYPGIVECLRTLKQRGHFIGLNTSGSDIQVLDCLDYNNIRDVFDFLGTKDVSISKKDKTHAFANVCNKPIHDIVFVFDTVGDWKEVRELQEEGLITVAVTYGLHSREHLEKHIEPTHFVNSVEDLYLLLS